MLPPQVRQLIPEAKSVPFVSSRCSSLSNCRATTYSVSSAPKGSQTNMGGETDFFPHEKSIRVESDTRSHRFRKCDVKFTRTVLSRSWLKRELSNFRCAYCRAEIPPGYMQLPTVVPRNPEDNPGLDTKYHWYYAGRNGWWQFEDRHCEELEQALSKGDSQ